MKLIASAFVKAQKSFDEAVKSSKNPFFKSDYAGLPECIDAVLPHLHAQNIAVMQPTFECADGVIVETLFIHESGETLSSGRLHVPASKNDPQAYGSALTYARRYSLASACSLKTADDDGNAASQGKVKPTAKVTPQVTSGTQKSPFTIEVGLKSCKSIDELKKVYSALSKPDQKLFATLKDDMKIQIVKESMEAQ